ncbi:hypothetical protein [Nocardia carnea]|uniref:hypothetical protein n=1 Tax=Nocardia carnea TaxID=37328 RepID=UPI00245847AC|nr:hypothetical protein [Nocardia carnea]
MRSRMGMVAYDAAVRIPVRTWSSLVVGRRVPVGSETVPPVPPGRAVPVASTQLESVPDRR